MFNQEIDNLQHMERTSTLFIDPCSILQPWSHEESRELTRSENQTFLTNGKK